MAHIAHMEAIWHTWLSHGTDGIVMAFMTITMNNKYGNGINNLILIYISLINCA